MAQGRRGKPHKLLPFFCPLADPGAQDLQLIGLIATLYLPPCNTGEEGIDLRVKASLSTWPFHLGIPIVHPGPDTEPGSVHVCEQ